MTFVTVERAAYFTLIADAYLAVMLAGIALVAFDLRRMMSSRMRAVRVEGSVSLSPMWLVPYVLSLKRYWKFFVASSLFYGVFYAIITNMIVYNPSVDFVQAPDATIPSVLVTTCCGAPLYTPIVTVYVTNHVGLLLIPLTVILLISVSALVGVNSALAAFAFDNRVRGTNKGWIGGVGAVVGLFTGCPTCAGLFFANVLGTSGAVSFAVLAYYQTVFIFISLPVLLVTPYLTSLSLGKVFREGCVYLKSGSR